MSNCLANVTSRKAAKALSEIDINVKKSTRYANAYIERC